MNKYRLAKKTNQLAPDIWEVQLRLGLLLAICVIGAIFVGLRLTSLKRELTSNKWRNLAEAQHHSELTIKGSRGGIIDRNGRTLADSVRTIDVALQKKYVDNSTWNELKAIFNFKPERINELNYSSRAFQWIARSLPDEMKLGLSKFPGLVVVPSFKRVYPNGRTLSTLIGNVGLDGNGLSGIEKQFDKVLKAQDLKLELVRDAKGRSIGFNGVTNNEVTLFSMDLLTGVSNAEAATPVNLRSEGEDIQLTVDLILQQIVEKEIFAAKEHAKARLVYATMMDATTGEILAIGSTDSFDANSKVTNIAELRSPVVQDSFEPGSTFKPLLVAAALEEQATHDGEIIDCEKGNYRVGNRVVHDIHPQAKLPLRDVLVRSSNVGVAKLGLRLGAEKIHSWIKDYGFGAKTKIAISGESKGILRDASQWSMIDQATHSFGQGFSVTAIQLVQAYGALANGGYLVKPALIKDDKIVKERVLSEPISKLVSDYIIGVTEDEHGTGRNAKVEGVRVHGKTGTAQKVVGGKYSPNKVFASFIGYVDLNDVGIDKKIVLFIGVDEPGVYPRWGGTVAAPSFSRIMEQTIGHYVSGAL